uniref:Uncharacterized protein n=1 Tax=Anguilla anguilla TaxID=7936 RepID=A0A0E9V5T4_ANGAN
MKMTPLLNCCLQSWSLWHAYIPMSLH